VEGRLEEAALDVGDGVQREVLLEVVHRVLRNVRDAQVVVLEEVAAPAVGHVELADEQLEQRRLPRAVGADQRDAGRHAQLRAHCVQHVARATVVAERHVGELRDRLEPRLHALQVSGVWELDKRLVLARDLRMPETDQT